MTQIGPFHAKRQDSPDKYHHVYLDCPVAQKTKWSDREQGDAQKPMCPECRKRAGLPEYEGSEQDLNQ